MTSPRLLQVAVMIAAVALVLWTDTEYDVDDAMITYRYAENLANGRGFVYNVGERFLGTSAPLYALTLGALGFAGIPIPGASNVLNLLGSLAVVAMTMQFGRRWAGNLAAGLIAATVLLVQAPFIRYSMAGMETPAYSMFVLGSLWALCHQKMMTATVLGSLSVLMRLDGLAVLAAVLVGVAQRRCLPRREALISLAILLPWFAFCFLYFGSIVPLSMTAKHQHLVSLGSNRYWIWDQLVWSSGVAPTYLTAFALLGVLRCFRSGWRSSDALPAVAWLCANISAYILVGFEYYEWYIVPLLPVLAAFAGVGLLVAVEAVGLGLRSGRTIPAVAVLAMVLAPYILYAHRSVREFKAYTMSVERSRAEAGRWLRANAAPGSRVFADAIGQVGYYSNLYILDGGGLVRPLGDDEFEGATHLVAQDEEATDAGPILKTFETGWSGYPARVVVRRYDPSRDRGPTAASHSVFARPGIGVDVLVEGGAKDSHAVVAAARIVGHRDECGASTARAYELDDRAHLVLDGKGRCKTEESDC